MLHQFPLSISFLEYLELSVRTSASQTVLSRARSFSILFCFLRCSLCWGISFCQFFWFYFHLSVCFCCFRIVALGCLLLHFASCFCAERCLPFISFSRVSLNPRCSLSRFPPPVFSVFFVSHSLAAVANGGYFQKRLFNPRPPPSTPTPVSAELSNASVWVLLLSVCACVFASVWGS